MKAVKSILLIEDDTDDQGFFVEALHDIANATLYGIVNNGKEALDKLAHSAILPTLIFTDINMPQMSGIEFLAEIAKRPRLNHTPVVMLSTDIGKKELACQLGAKAFIKKTPDFKFFREQIEQIINSAAVDGDMATPVFIPIPN